jgi:hypothetical protein
VRVISQRPSRTLERFQDRYTLSALLRGRRSLGSRRLECIPFGYGNPETAIDRIRRRSTGCAALHPWLFSRRPSGTGTCSAADARMEPTLAGGSHGCMPPLHSQNETEWRRGGRRCAPVDLVGHPPGPYPCESPFPPGCLGQLFCFQWVGARVLAQGTLFSGTWKPTI